jgi:outer membrane protein assembly factor BamD
LKSLKCHGFATRRFGSLIVLLLAAAFLSSCGGSYVARKVSMPGDKLALADGLFEKGKYARAVVEYRDFLATFAGDERSDYAQYRIAESYRMEKEYSLAAVEYRILVSDYGYSDYVDDAFFLEGLCAFKQAPRVERDQTKSYEALDRLNRYLQLFPNSPRRAEAESVVKEIHDRLAKKEFFNAKLYFSKKRYAAALVYFTKITDLYPETLWARRSQYYMGRIMEAKRDWAGAVKAYGDALSAAGDFSERLDAEKRLRQIQGSSGARERGGSG